MPRLHTVHVSTRSDVFIRLFSEIRRMKLRGHFRSMGPLVLQLALCAGILIAGGWAPVDDFMYKIDTLRGVLLTITAWLAAALLLTVLRLALWLWRDVRWTRKAACADLTPYDFTLTFDEEWVDIVTAGMRRSIRWDHLHRYTILPNTIHLWEKHDHWAMFAREYLGEDTFTAMASMAHEKIALRR